MQCQYQDMCDTDLEGQWCWTGIWQCNNVRVWHRTWMSRLTLRDITLHTSLREATTAVTFAEMPNFLSTDVHHPPSQPCIGPEQTRVWPRGQHWILLCTPWSPFDCSCVCTLITFICQVIGEPLLQSDGHPDTFQTTIFLSLQSQPSTYVTHEGSCRIPNINLQIQVSTPPSKKLLAP